MSTRDAARRRPGGPRGLRPPSDRPVVSSAAECAAVAVPHAGTLAAIRTTAPRARQRRIRPPARPAAVLVALATLAIAARCYASTAGTRPLVQLQPPPPPPPPSPRSPIDDSSAAPATWPHRRRLVRTSDTTSVIVRNSKKSLHNQKAPELFEDSSADTTANGTSAASATSGTNSSRLQEQRQRLSHQQDTSSSRSRGTERPMPPVHDHGNASSVSDLGVLVLVLSAIVLTVALGLVTCVLSHYRSVAGEGAADGGTAADPHDAAQTPTTAPMLSVVSAGAAAGVGGMDRLRGGRAARELAATRDRQVRLHAVQTDIAINLPPSIAMPDGEEHPFSSSRLLHLRDPEQESEIHQKCIRPPPNRTVSESESPPPYRSSCVGLLTGSSSLSSSSSCSTSSSSSGVGGGGCGGGSDWSGGSAPLVERCHSTGSSSASSASSSSAAAAAAAAKRPDGQKTDFLQRTVKIFTGGGRKAPAGGHPHHHLHHHHQPAAPTLLPAVNVPARPRRIANDQNNATAARPKPSV